MIHLSNVVLVYGGVKVHHFLVQFASLGDKLNLSRCLLAHHLQDHSTNNGHVIDLVMVTVFTW